MLVCSFRHTARITNHCHCTSFRNSPSTKTSNSINPLTSDTHNTSSHRNSSTTTNSINPNLTSDNANHISHNSHLHHTPSASLSTQAAVLPPPAPALSQSLAEQKIKWSFHLRPLPASLPPLSSPVGRLRFQNALSSTLAEAYFPLSEQFLTQSEPAYCGLSSLSMTLNALNIDPLFRWKLGWRWWSDDSILKNCCLDKEYVKTHGIDMDQFQKLAKCNANVNIKMHRRDNLDGPTASEHNFTINQFRTHVIESVSSGGVVIANSESNDCTNCGSISHLTSTCTSSTSHQSRLKIIVVSFSRSALGQTGDGHFSPIGAYDRTSDSVLLLDVARFKYPPYWVSVDTLYEAMKYKDEVTGLGRGYFLISSNPKSKVQDGTYLQAGPDDERRKYPAEMIRGDEGEVCPAGVLKTKYCKIEERRVVVK